MENYIRLSKQYLSVEGFWLANFETGPGSKTVFDILLL